MIGSRRFYSIYKRLPKIQSVLAFLLSIFLVLILGYKNKIVVQMDNLKIKRQQLELISRRIELKQAQNKRRVDAGNVVLHDKVAAIKIIDRIALACHVKLVSLELLSARQESYSIIQPYKLFFVGRYVELIGVLNELWQKITYVEVFELELKKLENSDLEMRLTLNIYDYATINGYKKTSAKIIAQQDLFSRSNKNPDLLSWSIAELKFLGTVKQHGVIYGMVLDPAANIYQVKVRDKLGFEQRSIINIGSCKITTDNPSDYIIGELCA